MSVDAHSFDLAEFFAGTNYPESEVTVFFDPRVSYRRAKLSEAARDAVNAKDEDLAAKIETDLAAINEEAEKSKFVFHLKGAPREAKKAIYNANIAKFKRKQDMFGRLESNPEADEEYDVNFWLAHIAVVETPGGGSVTPDEAWVRMVRGKAPEPALKAIQEGIDALSEETARGFEALVEDHAFLSMPSREG